MASLGARKGHSSRNSWAAKGCIVVHQMATSIVEDDTQSGAAFQEPIALWMILSGNLGVAATRECMIENIEL